MEPEPLGVKLDDATWTAALTYTRALVDACRQHPLARYIDTRQHAGDMEAVRVALDEPVIDFVGISYGSFVGLSYASIYPGHLRRILLDSSLDATTELDRTLQASTADRERIVGRLAIGEAVRHPDRWHLGNNRQALLDRLRRIPASLRVSLMPGIDSPESLIAVFALADTLDDTPGMPASDLRATLAKKRLNDDDALDWRIHERLQQMIDALLESPAPVSDAESRAGDQMLAVNLMTLCNDHR
ncbi:MAG: Tripeptidyl aminopeptidase [Luteibacter sp.]|nr:alpha/beta fold hydrolase [Luteibacter sp.]KAF1006319.1 MAG: Tripeptidyl aminopeptidase [Luteibacter sp.]